MLWLKPPPENPNFEQRKAKLVADVEKAIADGKNPKIDKALWSDFKVEFSAQQHGRCGYCELGVVVGHYGDVEHYAPKNEVSQFANGTAEEGTETAYVATLSGRNPSERWTPGYYWLAYQWSNYLLACTVCNSVWKGTLFPVKQPPARLRPRTIGDLEENCLLLNPYGKRDPARHLRFNLDGSVEPRNGSAYGRETIRTCGLNRIALRAARRPTCRRAVQALAEALDEMHDNVLLDNNEGLQDLHRMGSDGDDAEFPGVVRAIIIDQLAPMTWEALDELFGGA